MTPEQLKKEREKLGLSQLALGETLDRSERYVTYREGGDRPIDGMFRYAMIGLKATLRKKKK